MFCRECGVKHPSYNNYCPNDGQDLQPVFASQVEHRISGFCASCGNSVNSSAQYCQHCGESHSTMKLGTAKKASVSQANKPFAMPTVTKSFMTQNSLLSILMAVGITILLTISTAYIIKTQAESFVIDMSDGELTSSDFKTMNMLSDSIEEDLGMEIDLPNIYNVFTYISLMHSIDFELVGELSGKEDGESIQGDLQMNAQNLSLSSLFIVIILLVIGGLILGYIVKRKNLPLGESILGFSLIYGLFLMVSSFIASFSFKESFEIFYSRVNVNISGEFPLIESFMVGTFLASGVAGLAALLMVYGRDVFLYIRTKSSAIQYLVYSTFISLVGVSLFTGIYFSISGKYIEGELFSEQANAVGNFIAGPMGMWVWNLSHLIPLNFTFEAPGENEIFSLHLFSSYKKLFELDSMYTFSQIKELFFINDGLPLLLKASLLIPVVLLIIAGYHLYQTHRLNIIELVKFSLIYAVIMIFVRVFSSIEYSLSSSHEELFDIEQILVQIQPNLIPVFIISSLFALAFFSLGGYLKRYLGENV